MSTKDAAAENAAATTEPRQIETGRLTKALTQDMAVDVVAPGMYDVAHDGETYTVDVEGGSCGCKDHQYRGDEYVCKHVIKASVRHAFMATPNTALVARVLAAVREHGCPHDEPGCGGPTQLGDRGYPCPDCVEASGTGDWVVYQRLVEQQTPAGAPVAMADGGQPDDDRCEECGRRTELPDDHDDRELHTADCPNLGGTVDPYADEREEVDETPL